MIWPLVTTTVTGKFSRTLRHIKSVCVDRPYVLTKLFTPSLSFLHLSFTPSLHSFLPLFSLSPSLPPSLSLSLSLPLSLWHPSSLFPTSPLLSPLPPSLTSPPLLCQAGGMQALSRHLGHRSTRLVHNILHTLRNLSDMATKQVCFIITVYMYTSTYMTPLRVYCTLYMYCIMGNIQQ